jgi:tRNA A37 methylthiotransferase MiaB
LRALAARRLDAYLQSQLGMVASVLVESGDRGRTPGFAEVRLDRPATPGRIVPARITGQAAGKLEGMVLA